MSWLDDIGPASTIPDSEIGRAVARQIVSSFDGDRPDGRPGDAIVLARAAGVTVLAIEQMTGWARQTVYRHQKAVGQPREIDRGLARLELLVFIAANGRASIAKVARRLLLPTVTVLPAAIDLVPDLASLDMDANLDDRVVGPTEATYAELRRYFNRHIDRQPAGYLVCLEIPDQADPAAIQKATDEVLSSQHGDDGTVADPEVAPSAMRGHELLLPTRTPTQSRAIEFAYEAWPRILGQAKLKGDFPAKIRDVIPPGSPQYVNSRCLDCLVETLHEHDAGTPEKLRELRSSYSGDLGEKSIASKCLTEAAIALRRAAGDDRNPHLISHGDDAFDEWEFAQQQEIDPSGKDIRESVVAALDLASNKLGPHLGGELGHFKALGAQPEQPREVSPTMQDLLKISELSAIAIAAADRLRLVSANAVVTRILDSSYRA